MGVRKLVFGAGGVALVLAYFLHTPYPVGIHAPYTKSMKNNILRTIDHVARIGGYFGVCNEVDIVRRMLHFITSFSHIDNSSSVKIWNTVMDGVEVRIYQPRDCTGLLPGLVYIHGGGWIFFEPADYDPTVHALARDIPAVVVSVNYRRAPEHPYPAAFNDCVKTIKYLMRNANMYGMDRDRIGVAGDSAGGNIATAVVMKLTSDFDPSLSTLKYQVLTYPAVQIIDFNTPSYLTYKDGPSFITRSLQIAVWLAYIGGNKTQINEFSANAHLPEDFETSVYSSYIDPKHLPDFLHKPVKPTRSSTNTTLFNEIKHLMFDPYFAPLTASDELLRNLPPTFILNAEVDVLRDDGFFYARRLRNVGVKVEHEYVASEEHGYVADLSEISYKSIRNIVQFINDNI